MRLPSSALDRTFSALADPTRRAILSRLAKGESSVGELAAPFNMSLPAVSKHLRVLEGAGLLRRQKDGRVHRCRLDPGAMKEASDWISFYRRFWEAQFDSLENYLNEMSEEKPKWRHQKHPPKPPSTSRGSSRPRGKKPSGRGRTRKN